MSAIDTLVGQRIKARRQALNMTQSQLADQIGVTFQQVQKYENGSNRVSAARLYEIANVFDVSITFFFETVTQDENGATTDPLSDKASIEVMELFTKLNAAQKDAVLSFLRSVAAEGSTKLPAE